MKKIKILILIVIVLAIGFVSYLGITKFCSKHESTTIGTTYIADKSALYLDCGPASIFTNHLLYTPSLDIKYKPDLAKSVKKNGSQIIVEYKDQDLAKVVYDSYFKLFDEVYENSRYFGNIKGYEEYANLESENVSGMKLENNKIIFDVFDIEDLDFLTIPTLGLDTGYTLLEYNNDRMVIGNDKQAYEFINVLSSQQANEELDIFVTSKDEADLPISCKNMSHEEIQREYDYIILNNINDELKEDIQKIFAGKKVNSKNASLMLWVDSSYDGALIADKLKENFADNFQVDYGYREYFIGLLGSEEPFACFYEDNGQDLSIFNGFDKVSVVKIPKRCIHIYYNNAMKIAEFI